MPLISASISSTFTKCGSLYFHNKSENDICTVSACFGISVSLSSVNSKAALKRGVSSSGNFQLFPLEMCFRDRFQAGWLCIYTSFKFQQQLFSSSSSVICGIFLPVTISASGDSSLI
jgi:hypothetical protein